MPKNTSVKESKSKPKNKETKREKETPKPTVTPSSVDTIKAIHMEKSEFDPLRVAFSCRLSNAHVLIEEEEEEPPVPIDHTHKMKEEVHGEFYIKFSPDLSSAYYKLYVWNSDIHTVTSASLYAGYANQIGEQICNIFHLIDDDPTSVNGVLSKGILTNEDIEHIHAPNGYPLTNMAALYQAIEMNMVYVQVDGVRPFDKGLLRGQIFVSYK